MARYLIITAALLVLGAALGFVFLGRSSQAGGFTTVTVQDLARAAETKHIVLDVREPWEVAEGFIAGAMLIPLGQLSARVHELPQDTPVYVICRSGNRSVAASELLVAAGHKDVRNVGGGMLAWQAVGLSVTR